MSAGKWTPLYKNATQQHPYGDETTYRLGAEYLRGLSIEDWGCGYAWMRRIHAGPYKGIDGSLSPFADKIVNLCAYRSQTEGIFMRHVLEHNDEWLAILENALASFTHRMVLVLFTPMVENTANLFDTPMLGGTSVPNISFARSDLLPHIQPYLDREERLRTGTYFSEERIFYLDKSPLSRPPA